MSSSWQGMGSLKRTSSPLTAAPSRFSLYPGMDHSQLPSEEKNKCGTKTPPPSTNRLSDPREEAMINRHTVFEIHRLCHEGLSKQRIAATLHVDPKTVRKFLTDP